ncbi:MAG: DUF1189 family protein [Alphaproteobacteria bacterium]|nr:DUF1189 family protein [Alphaproteobacteria bacterium]MBP3515461.1 DUF1189 family protein [Alphaproteobacteria bacterium]
MEQIINYIKNGKGVGLLIILAAAVLSTIAFIFTARYFYNQAQPQIMLIAQDFLPVTIKSGKIINPVNTYKRIDLNLGNPKEVFPIVMDTRQEVSQTPTAKQGLFIMADKIYVALPKQTRIFNLDDGLWDQKKFEDFLNHLTGAVFTVLTLIGTGTFFLMYLFKSWIVSVFGLFTVKIMKKEKLFDFPALMRLSALLVCPMEIIGLGLNTLSGLSISGMQIFILALILEGLFIGREDTNQA